MVNNEPVTAAISNLLVRKNTSANSAVSASVYVDLQMSRESYLRGSKFGPPKAIGASNKMLITA